MGMAIASNVILPQLLSDKRDVAGEVIFHGLSVAEKADIRLHDLEVIRNPYVMLGVMICRAVAFCDRMRSYYGKNFKNRSKR